MNFKTKLYERFLYPIYQGKFGLTYGCKSINIYRNLNKSQWLSRDEMIAYQTKKLKKLIEYVYSNIPYYGGLMHKIGIRPQDVNSIEDLKYLPVLTKSEIKTNFDGIVSKDFQQRNVIKASTGGTTGEPLIFYRDLSTRIWTEAALLRGWSWANYRLGHTAIKFSNDDWPSILGRIRTKLVNLYYFPEFVKNDQIINCFQEIKRLRPFCLSGLSSNLYRIAAVCEKYNINGIGFTAIFTTAEMLYDYQRDLLEKQFKGRVYDYYGCNEIGSLAYECESRNKHITDEHVIVETIDSEGNNIMNLPGEVTITDLDNYAMPFIRYKNGDVGTLTDKQCDCGRGLSLLQSVDGRSQEFLKTSDGNYVPGIFFPARFRTLKGIEQYQIIQSDVHHVTLKIVKNQFYLREELEVMISIIKKAVGMDVHIDVEECEHIPLTGRGKTRLVISHVQKDF